MNGSDFRGVGVPEPPDHAEKGTPPNSAGTNSSRWRESQPLPPPSAPREPRRLVTGSVPGRARVWPPEPALDPRRLMPPPRPNRVPEYPPAAQPKPESPAPAPGRLRRELTPPGAEPNGSAQAHSFERGSNRLEPLEPIEPPRPLVPLGPERLREQLPTVEPGANHGAASLPAQKPVIALEPQPFIAPPPVKEQREPAPVFEPEQKSSMAPPPPLEPEVDFGPSRPAVPPLWERLRGRAPIFKAEAKRTITPEPALNSEPFRFIAPPPIERAPEISPKSAATPAGAAAPVASEPALDSAPQRFIAPPPVEGMKNGGTVFGAEPRHSKEPPPFEEAPDSAPQYFIAPPPAEPVPEKTPKLTADAIGSAALPPFESQLEPDPLSYIPPLSVERVPEALLLSVDEVQRIAPRTPEPRPDWPSEALEMAESMRSITPSPTGRAPQEPSLFGAETRPSVSSILLQPEPEPHPRWSHTPPPELPPEWTATVAAERQHPAPPSAHPLEFGVAAPVETLPEPIESPRFVDPAQSERAPEKPPAYTAEPSITAPPPFEPKLNSEQPRSAVPAPNGRPRGWSSLFGDEPKPSITLPPLEFAPSWPQEAAAGPMKPPQPVDSLPGSGLHDWSAIFAADSKSSIDLSAPEYTLTGPPQAASNRIESVRSVIPSPEKSSHDWSSIFATEPRSSVDLSPFEPAPADSQEMAPEPARSVTPVLMDTAPIETTVEESGINAEESEEEMSAKPRQLPKMLKRLMNVGRAALPVVPQFLPKEGKIGVTVSAVSAVSSALAAHAAQQSSKSAPALTPGIDGTSIAETLDELRAVQRELGSRIVQQTAVLERVQDQVQFLCEGAERSAQEQQHLVDEMKFFSRWGLVFAIAVAILLFAAVGFDVMMFMRF